MTSRHRTRTTHTQRPEDIPSWTPNEPEPGHPRQAMASTQRHNTERTTDDGHRKHRSSSKRAETSDAVAPSAPVTSHSKSSSKHRSSTQPSTSYHATYPGTHAASSATPVAATSSRAQGVDDPSRSHAKSRSEKPSPRSSNERVALPEDSRSVRHGRTAYPTVATVQAPASTQAYYVEPTQMTSETASKHRRERDKDRDKERERERRREEKAKARLQETESLRAKEKERDRERRREREREAERVSRDRESHRDPERTKERERRREERRAAERAALQAQAPSTAAYRPQQVDDRPAAISVRH
ncbi:hypothetical protein DAEQUDRAFT_377874 [Daedalea quercina L-15889]|uniref:Uncharacterized protein n=1 Tax=Daedalea quercina L-15889 TaxID=1314783 RepID=A0A165P3H6_9APHY|nr:hypothetical protein DAEQUDRAFT_377874 [Daedalea quercina L-15889]